MGNRTWIKLHRDKWLEGSIRDEAPEIREATAEEMNRRIVSRYAPTATPYSLQ